MTPGTDVAVATTEELELLQRQQEEEFGDDNLFSTPILKIGQGLTKEVQAGDADQGEFINTLTGEGVGDKIGFVIAYYQQGRFAADRDSGRAFVAFDSVIPEAWADHPAVGEEFIGTPFAEHPDAEEVYKKRVNRKEIEWGKGPAISTTHNFTGLAIVPGVGDEEAELQAVRLSLQRSNMDAVRNILTLKRTHPKFRNKPFWERVLDLSTYRKEFKKGNAFLLNVKVGRETTADERSEAVTLAQAVAAGRVVDNQADEAGADRPSEPDAKGGLSV